MTANGTARTASSNSMTTDGDIVTANMYVPHNHHLIQNPVHSPQETMIVYEQVSSISYPLLL